MHIHNQTQTNTLNRQREKKTTKHFTPLYSITFSGIEIEIKNKANKNGWREVK